jgi:predicted nucleic acid-binding protein
VPVLDASAALDLLLKTPIGVRSEDRLFEAELHAPHLIDIEFANALRRLTLAGKATNERATLALETLASLPLIRHSHVPFVPRIWGLCLSLSAYDAAYVSLAESLDIPLITSDSKLAHSHGHRAKIELLA